MSPDQTLLSRRRLALGITNVGFWVLAACAGLFWIWSNSATTPETGILLKVAACAIAAQAVFDIIGGVVLMPAQLPHARPFIIRWLRGVLGHSIALCVVGAISAASLKLTGGFSAGIVLSMCLLAAGRRLILQALGGVGFAEVEQFGNKTLLVTVDDPAFTGGILGLGRRAKSVIPAQWIPSIPPAEIAAESSRRKWQIDAGLPLRAFAVIVCWNTLGAFAGTIVFNPSELPLAAAIFGHSCWMTLWTFLSLLVLPSLSRAAVFAADIAALKSGNDPRDWIKRFPKLVSEDGSPNTAVQTIFYPVPSAAMRLAMLEKPFHGFPLGSLARNNLFYSWCGLTLLGRSVHCNVGRPVLWVFPPSA
jgi:hypothetical protein